jgi:hypothetical protein
MHVGASCLRKYIRSVIKIGFGDVEVDEGSSRASSRPDKRAEQPLGM